VTVALPTLTFALPFYSGIAYLPRALASLRAQRDPDWRAFVCDNASPEPGLGAMVAALGDARITYVRNATNLGMAGNFNRCLDLADTDLVTLLHADDELEPGYAGAFRAAAARFPDAVALFCRATIIGERSQRLLSIPDLVKDRITPIGDAPTLLRGEPALRALLRGNFIVAPTLCFRRQILGARRFPAGYKFVLDAMLTTDLLLAGEALVGLPERLYRYRRHGGNATEAMTRDQVRFREEQAYFEHLREAALARGWDACARLAADKRILKLNVAFKLLTACAKLSFAEARGNFHMLRELAGRA